MARTLAWFATLAAFAFGPGCRKSPAEPAPTPASKSPGRTATGVSAAWPADKRADWLPCPLGPTEPLLPWLAAESARATAEHQAPLIYVGATWCEPCRRFHAAVLSGALNPSLPGVRFLELDADRHAQGIREAGCESQYIPLFAVPGPDGRCSPLRAAGGVKGDGALGFILPRVQALLRGELRLPPPLRQPQRRRLDPEQPAQGIPHPPDLLQAVGAGEGGENRFVEAGEQQLHLAVRRKSPHQVQVAPVVRLHPLKQGAGDVQRYRERLPLG